MCFLFPPVLLPVLLFQAKIPEKLTKRTIAPRFPVFIGKRIRSAPYEDCTNDKYLASNQRIAIH